jgi:DNA-directed RNA polymerase specialized sigma subunit
MALPLENHKEQINEVEVSSADIELGIRKLNQKLKEVLKPNEWVVYEGFYIDNKTEQEIAEILNFKTTEKNRTPGYKQIKNIQKSIITKARKILSKDGLDWI